jgi:hypothetical protein
MAESLLVRKGGGGAKIEELIQQYTIAVGETVTPGTFVDFVRANSIQKQTITGNISNIRVVALDDTRVLTVYTFYNGTNSSIRGRVITFNGTSITLQNETIYTQIATTPLSFTFSNMIKLAPNRVIFCYETPSNRYAAFGAVLVSTTTSSLFFWDTINSFNSNTFVYVERVDDFQFLMTFKNGTTNPRINTYYFTADYSGLGTRIPTDITTTINAQYSTIVNMGSYIVVTFYDAVNTAYSICLVISGNQLIPQTTPSSLGFPDVQGGLLYSLKIADNTLMILYQRQGNNGTYFLVGRIAVFNGTSRTSLTNGFVLYNKMLQLGNDNFFAFDFGNNLFGLVSSFRDDGTNGNVLIFVKRINNELVFDSEIILETTNHNTNVGIILINNHLLLSSRQEGVAAKYNLLRYGKIVKNATGERVFGLAKTGGTAGQTVEVFVNE